MAAKPTGKQAGQVRIIGGRWRGRKLALAGDEVRPSADRVRETLFNWLDPVLRGAHVLDLFAGTGVLGLEALSRGAERALLVENSKVRAQYLREHAAKLGASECEVLEHDARRLLTSRGGPFDVVFLDPPFADDDLGDLCKLLDSHGWLAADARIYLEQDKAKGLPDLPESWELLKQKVAGQVCFGLAAKRID